MDAWPCVLSTPPRNIVSVEIALSRGTNANDLVMQGALLVRQVAGRFVGERLQSARPSSQG